MPHAPQSTAGAKQRYSQPEMAHMIRELPNAPQAVAAYAADLKRMSNYEVWKRVESAIQATSSQEGTESDSLCFLALLDELQWRHSGLEGAGTLPDLDRTVTETH